MTGFDGTTRRGHLDPIRLDALRAGEGTREEESHLAECPNCRGKVEFFRQSAVLLERVSVVEGEIPTAIDARIHHEFRRTVRRTRRPFALPRWLIPAFGTAAAAALVLVITFEKGSTPSRPGDAPAPVAVESRVAGDVNGDGAVDMLDAFNLAMMLQESGGEPEWADMDGDGRVSLVDVDSVARLAVTL